MYTIQDLLFGRPLLSEIPVATLQRWLDWLYILLDALPLPQLTPKDRVQLAGYSFLEGTLLCWELERALTADPALFAAWRGMIPRWISLGPRQVLWLHLRDVLVAAAARAEEQYLLARGERISAALDLVRAGSGTEQPLAEQLDPQMEERRDRLAPARRVISAWQDRIHRRRRRH